MNRRQEQKLNLIAELLFRVAYKASRREFETIEEQWHELLEQEKDGEGEIDGKHKCGHCGHVQSAFIKNRLPAKCCYCNESIEVF